MDKYPDNNRVFLLIPPALFYLIVTILIYRYGINTELC